MRKSENYAHKREDETEREKIIKGEIESAKRKFSLEKSTSLPIPFIQSINPLKTCNSTPKLFTHLLPQKSYKTEMEK